ncbi:hypothetical protein J2X60_000960 [Curtobacterium sp. 320]|uniref:hypothetical protein n=1 Tax=Curtobacterium sp. 320 TaxID=2817749 RepID=UPI00285FCA52|nr:hypothetical protein [Curtobacterium sp. 320]MDR6572324.1 hypothetical protein [Curtobacterium sp. 320]
MISVQGIELIATVIPVGLLVLTIEFRRTILTLVADLKYLWARIAACLLLVVASVGSVLAEVLCISSVGSNVPLGGFDAVFVTVPLVTLGFVVMGAISTTIGRMIAAILFRATDDEIRKLDL